MTKKLLAIGLLLLVAGFANFANNTIASTAEGNLSTVVQTGLEGVMKAAPTVSPAAGSYTSTQSVSLTASGASKICYTTNGSTTPSCATSTTCTAGTALANGGTVSVASTTTIKSAACYTDASTGPVVTSAYTISSGGGGGGGGTYVPPADTTPPSATSVSINAGAATASSLSATLTLAATDATQMLVSNDAGFAGASWETYATSKSWTLISGDGVKTVYAKFRDAALNMSTAVSDTITVSGSVTVAPVVTTPAPTQGCSGDNQYNTLTGALCVNNAGAEIPGCGNSTSGFSTASGLSCAGNRVTTTTTPTTPTTPSTSSGPSAYNFGTTTLKNGSKGEAVEELQRFLNAELNLGLIIDGSLGPKTIAVIKKWQKDNGLVADGLIGAKTKEMMNASVTTTTTTTAPTTTTSGTVLFTSALRQGSRGNEVTRLQEFLRDQGFFTAVANGNFGPVTKAALQAFQEANGLTADGALGPKTRAKVNAML